MRALIARKTPEGRSGCVAPANGSKSRLPLGLGAFRAQRGAGRRRIVRPGMPGVSAAHFLRHRAPTARPEAGEVARRLDRPAGRRGEGKHQRRSEEHTSELQSLMRISYDVFCLKKKTNQKK